MRILYVDLQYDYGKRERGSNQIGDLGFRKAFESLGHQVMPFYYDEYFNEGKMLELQSDLIANAKSVNPDLIYFNLFTDQFSIETLDTLRSISKTMNWFGDDQWRFETFTKKYAPHFTYCVTTDPYSISKYRDLGINNVILSQWAALDYNLPDSGSVKYEYDVSFVGGYHSVRSWFIAELEKLGIKVARFGHGWQSGSVSLEEMVQIFRKSKINLNLSNSMTFDFRYLMHEIKNPVRALRSKKTASQIKARNFEIPFYGGFQLTDYVPSIETYFNIGKEISCYRDVEEAAMLIQYYLKNDEERERVRAAGILRARSEHSYIQRHRQVFEAMVNEVR